MRAREKNLVTAWFTRAQINKHHGRAQSLAPQPRRESLQRLKRLNPLTWQTLTREFSLYLSTEIARAGNGKCARARACVFSGESAAGILKFKIAKSYYAVLSDTSMRGWLLRLTTGGGEIVFHLWAESYGRVLFARKDCTNFGENFRHGTQRRENLSTCSERGSFFLFLFFSLCFDAWDLGVESGSFPFKATKHFRVRGEIFERKEQSARG